MEPSGSPCPDNPVEANVQLRLPGGQFTPPVRTGSDGRFRIQIGPGTYQVWAHEIGDNPRTAKPLDVTVAKSSFVSVTLLIQTGAG